tara:strand:- start:254 stop:649 length:396 start_codon:yes stop_codon:yes gene_type:complete
VYFRFKEYKKQKMIKKNRLKAALDGLATVFRGERNFKVHVFIFFLILLLGFFFQIKTWEWILVLFTSAMVFSAEMFNTAIENICDYIEPKMDSKIGKIKDISASAVLTCAVISAVIGLLIFTPYFVRLLCD